jgi:hypothetical protein
MEVVHDVHTARPKIQKEVPMSDSRKVTADKRHPSALTEALLGHVEHVESQPERFVGDPPGVAESWEATPTRSGAAAATPAPGAPSVIITDPGSGIVAQPIKDETTRPTTTAELVAAVDAGRLTPSAALDQMAHRGKRKK